MRIPIRTGIWSRGSAIATCPAVDMVAGVITSRIWWRAGIGTVDFSCARVRINLTLIVTHRIRAYNAIT
jgi:hypothetical protein